MNIWDSYFKFNYVLNSTRMGFQKSSQSLKVFYNLLWPFVIGFDSKTIIQIHSAIPPESPLPIAF